jgi:hypothetical protein
MPKNKIFYTFFKFENCLYSKNIESFCVLFCLSIIQYISFHNFVLNNQKISLT